MFSEKELIKIANKLNNKKAKANFKEQVKMFDKLKGLIGAENVERPKIPNEFKNEEDFEKYVREYVKRNSNEIAEFSNRILMLNEKVRASESEDDIMELYTEYLMGLLLF